MTEVHLHGVAPVVLKPGDRALIAIADDMSYDDMVEFSEEARKKLSSRFPGVEFTFISNVNAISIIETTSKEPGS